MYMLDFLRKERTRACEGLTDLVREYTRAENGLKLTLKMRRETSVVKLVSVVAPLQCS